jgi:hypothetical protein
MILPGPFPPSRSGGSRRRMVAVSDAPWSQPWDLLAAASKADQLLASTGKSTSCLCVFRQATIF